MLAHILQFHAPTLAASGSINTLMGITRHIREDLVHGHRFMVVEMGAFKTGSIRRLCQLTPPSAGLITAVGDMHLERFGSTDEIVRAKSELAQALPPGGLLVVNADSPGALRIAKAATALPRAALRRNVDRGSRDAGRADPLLEARARPSCSSTHERAYTLLHAAPRPPDHPEPGRRVHAGDGARRRSGCRGRGAPDAQAGRRTGSRSSRSAASSGFATPTTRISSASARRSKWPRRCRWRAGFSRRPASSSWARSSSTSIARCREEASAVCDNTLVVAETNREAFVAGHRDAGREARLVPVPNRTEAFRWLREHAEGRRRRHPRERPAGSLRADRRRVLEGRQRGRRHERTTVADGGRAVRRALARARRLGRQRTADPARHRSGSVRADADLHRSGDCAGGSATTCGTREAFKGGGPDRARLTEVTLSPGFGTSTLVPVSGRRCRASGARGSRRRRVRAGAARHLRRGRLRSRALLELGGCAYVGCGVLASAVGMNKRVTKIVAAQAGVPVVPVACRASASVLDRGSRVAARRCRRSVAVALRLAGDRQAVQPGIERRRVDGRSTPTSSSPASSRCSSTTSKR